MRSLSLAASVCANRCGHDDVGLCFFATECCIVVCYLMDGGVGGASWENIDRLFIRFLCHPAGLLAFSRRSCFFIFYFVSSVSLSLFLLRSPPPESLTGVASVEFLSGALTSTSCSNWMTTGRPPIPLARVGRLIREEEKEAGTFPHCGIEILCLFSSLCPLHPNLLVSCCLFFFLSRQTPLSGRLRKRSFLSRLIRRMRRFILWRPPLVDVLLCGRFG